jgi:hypothetical protein
MVDTDNGRTERSLLVFVVVLIVNARVFFTLERYGWRNTKLEIAEEEGEACAKIVPAL